MQSGPREHGQNCLLTQLDRREAVLWQSLCGRNFFRASRFKSGFLPAGEVTRLARAARNQTPGGDGPSQHLGGFALEQQRPGVEGSARRWVQNRHRVDKPPPSRQVARKGDSHGDTQSH